MNSYLEQKLRSPGEAQRERLADGDRVTHPEWGPGMITGIQLSPVEDARDTATVRFFRNYRHRTVRLGDLVKSDLRVP